MMRCQVAAAIVDSCSSVLLGARTPDDAFDCPGVAEVPSQSTAAILEAAAGLAQRMCGLRVGVHIVPVGIMSAEQAARSGLVWVLFSCCDCACDSGNIELMSMIARGSKEEGFGTPEFGAMRWVPLQEVADAMPAPKRAAYQHLLEWALPSLESLATRAHATRLVPEKPPRPPQAVWRLALGWLALGWRSVRRSGLAGPPTHLSQGQARAWVQPLSRHLSCSAQETDLSGQWARDSRRSRGVVEGLLARGCAIAARPIPHSARPPSARPLPALCHGRADSRVPVARVPHPYPGPKPVPRP